MFSNTIKNYLEYNSIPKFDLSNKVRFKKKNFMFLLIMYKNLANNIVVLEMMMPH